MTVLSAAPDPIILPVNSAIKSFRRISLPVGFISCRTADRPDARASARRSSCRQKDAASSLQDANAGVRSCPLYDVLSVRHPWEVFKRLIYPFIISFPARKVNLCAAHGPFFLSAAR